MEYQGDKVYCEEMNQLQEEKAQLSTEMSELQAEIRLLEAEQSQMQEDLLNAGKITIDVDVEYLTVQRVDIILYS